MAKTSIRPESEEPVRTEAPLAVVQNAPLANYDAERYDDVSRDITVPVLGLVNKIGPLSKKFPKNVGEFAFGDQFLLGESVAVIPIAIIKLYVEKYRNGQELKFGVPVTPPAKTFASANDAAKAGYAVDFDSNYPNRVEEASRVAFLVLKPEGDQSGEFMLKAATFDVALMKSSYQRGSHRGVFRPLVNHANKIALAKGIKTVGMNACELFAATEAFTHLWTLTPEHVENTARQQDWYESRISKSSALPSEVVAWIKENYDGFAV